LLTPVAEYQRMLTVAKNGFTQNPRNIKISQLRCQGRDDPISHFPSTRFTVPLAIANLLTSAAIKVIAAKPEVLSKTRVSLNHYYSTINEPRYICIWQ